MQAPTTPQCVMLWVLSAICEPVTGTCRMKGSTDLIFKMAPGCGQKEMVARGPWGHRLLWRPRRSCAKCPPSPCCERTGVASGRPASLLALEVHDLAGALHVSQRPVGCQRLPRINDCALDLF